jgi:hypothetical protein
MDIPLCLEASSEYSPSEVLVPLLTFDLVPRFDNPRWRWKGKEERQSPLIGLLFGGPLDDAGRHDLMNNLKATVQVGST